MILRIKEVKPLENYLLQVVFDDGKSGIYDVKDDINTIPQYRDLKTIEGMFKQAKLDESRTCVFWSDEIDLPSDAIYENLEEPSQNLETRVNERKKTTENEISNISKKSVL